MTVLKRKEKKREKKDLPWISIKQLKAKHKDSSETPTTDGGGGAQIANQI